MTENDSVVADLALDVLDGRAVDWNAVESSVSDADRPLLAQLRVIATLARAALSHPPLLSDPSLGIDRPDACGAQWGHLRVLEPIGSGAFGEVYRAWDTHLDREVALKITPADSARHTGQRPSTIEEGRLLARIRHPNVVTIYGAEQIGSWVGLWMEFVRGRTVQQTMADGRVFSEAETIRIGVELGEAVAAVHGAGLLHRDIKAQNVMLNETGRAMLMDLGTGRELGEKSGSDLAGTPLYLAPEVLHGRSATATSDIYSLGVLLYHMLTGTYPVKAGSVGDLQRAHDGGQRKSIRAARPELSAKLARIIDRAIDPRPDHRYLSAEAFAAALTALTSRARRVRAAYALAASTTLIALVAAVVATTGSRDADNDARARTAPRVVPVTSEPGSKLHPVLSPDGTRVAFTWDRGGHQVHVKPLDSDSITQLTRLGGAYPAWSPDGGSLAFVRRTAIDAGVDRDAVITMSASGGPERTVLTDPTLMIGTGLDWSPDGSQLVVCARHARGEPWRLALISVASGAPRWLTSPPRESFGDIYPVFSPDGGSIAFVRDIHGRTGISTVDVAGGEPRRLMTIDSPIRRPAWSSDGRTLFFTVYRGGSRDSLWKIAAGGGEPERVAGIGEGATDSSTARFADRMVFIQRLRDQNLYRAELTHEDVRSATRLAASTREDVQPDFSPDGSRIAFVSDRSGFSEVWVMKADASDPVALTSLKHVSRHPRWSPDGRFVAFAARISTGLQADIHVVDAASRAVRRLTFESSNDTWPTWSADSRWIYFLSDRGGTREIWGIPAAGGNAEQVTRTGGLKARESQDGRLLYFSNSTPGVFRMKLPDGAPILAFGMPGGTTWGGEWVLASTGIYWLNAEASPRPSIDFYSFATGRTHRAVTPPGRFDAGGGFSVSPDGRWLVFTQRDYDGSDIMLVDGVR